MTQQVTSNPSVAYIVDDDPGIRECLSGLLQSLYFKVAAFGSAKEFLLAKRSDSPSCLILDVRLPGMGGLELQTELNKRGDYIPIIFVSGHADVPMGVQAIKAGAVEFLCKPFREQDLLDAVSAAIRIDVSRRNREKGLSRIRKNYERLTPREREIMKHVVGGMMNKLTAHTLGLSEITVKVHRASILKKMNASSVTDLVRQADAMASAKAEALAQRDKAIRTYAVNSFADDAASPDKCQLEGVQRDPRGGLL